MAFNGSGLFVRVYNWITDRDNGIKIRADRFDAEMDGMATGLSTCITKDGQTTITANIPFNSFKATGLGDATATGNAVHLGQAARVFNPVKYGVNYDASVDNTTAINNTIAAAVAAGGGTIVIEGYCRMDGCLTIPYTGTAPPVQKPIRITGNCYNFNGTLGGTAGTIGAVLDLRYAGLDGLHPAKIDARGVGVLEIDHLTIKSGGSDDFLILQSTNTTLNIHDVVVVGREANSGTSCAQDAFQLGGITGASTTLGGTGATNGFQGYGSTFRDINFSHIRHAVNFGGSANSVNFVNMITDQTCGTSEAHGAPFYVYGVGLGCVGNVFLGGGVEMNHYPHAFAIHGGNLNTPVAVFGVAAGDPGGGALSFIYCNDGVGAFSQRILPGFLDTIPLATGAGAYKVPTLVWKSYTPVIASSAGSITSYSISSATYARIDDTVFWQVSVTMTNIGTATGRLVVDLPSQARIANAGPVTGMNFTTQGALTGFANLTSDTTADVVLYNGTFPATAGQILCMSGWYNAI